MLRQEGLQTLKKMKLFQMYITFLRNFYNNLTTEETRCLLPMNGKRFYPRFTFPNTLVTVAILCFKFFINL